MALNWKKKRNKKVWTAQLGDVWCLVEEVNWGRSWFWEVKSGDEFCKLQASGYPTTKETAIHTAEAWAERIALLMRS